MIEFMSQKAYILIKLLACVSVFFFIKCICHYRYIFKINFRFQPKVCNGCHDMTQKSTNLNDFATVTVKGNDYKVNFWFMAKSEAVDRMKNAYLSKKNRTNTKIKRYLL